MYKKGSLGPALQSEYYWTLFLLLSMDQNQHYSLLCPDVCCKASSEDQQESISFQRPYWGSSHCFRLLLLGTGATNILTWGYPCHILQWPSKIHESSWTNTRHTSGRHWQTGTFEQPRASVESQEVGELLGQAMANCRETMSTGWKDQEATLPKFSRPKYTPGHTGNILSVTPRMSMLRILSSEPIPVGLFPKISLLIDWNWLSWYRFQKSKPNAWSSQNISI